MTRTDMTSPDPSLLSRLTLNLSPEALAQLARQIQYGSRLPVAADESRTVREFMVDALGLAPDYVESRVATVFLDGRAVDDLDAQQVRPGSCLSLSAAMPGVAGIVMRRSSPFKRMRALELFEEKESCEGGDVPGLVEIKLFNFIAVEAGPVLLARGLALVVKRLAALLEDAEFLAGIVGAELDGAERPVAALAASLPVDPEALVLVTAREA